MSSTAMAKIWNADLAHAAEVRVWYHQSKGSSKEFMWRKAHEAILAVKKEIRQYSSGRVVNMPKLKERTTLLELEAILRGEKPIVPPEMQEAEPVERDYAQHPYLKRMQFRGGGYAILMALHSRSASANLRQFMYKSELIHDAQPYCDVTMEGGWGAANGWTSIRSLLSHRLVLSSKGPQGGREEFHLTPEGQRFVTAMLQRWGGGAPGRAGDGDGGEAERNPAMVSPSAARGRSRGRSRSRGARPRWAAPTFRPAAAAAVRAAPTPCMAKPTVQQELEEIEISSESESARDVESRSQVVLLVDERERLRNTEPRRFFERIERTAAAGRRRLKLGDFAWTLSGGPMVDLLLERKRIEDLVGRSAKGDHLRQLRRMERSGLRHLFFLIEGNQSQASNCTVYDTEEAKSLESAIYCKEDIDAFCAQLIVDGSKVGVLQTRDSAGTIRLLKSISNWLAWTLAVHPENRCSVLTGTTLQQFEMELPDGTSTQDDLGAMSASRTAQMEVSRRLFHRLHQPADTSTLTWCTNELPDLCGELVICDGHVDPMSFVIVDGGLLLHEILAAATPQRCAVAVADAAARAVAAQLPSTRARRRLLIVEGLCKAVQAFARGTCPSPLPREEILPCAELVILLLDLTYSWRCRVHNSEAVETTKSFLQVLVQVALGTRQI